MEPVDDVGCCQAADRHDVVTRRLIIMRHAEAVEFTAEHGDFQRPLTARGRSGAALAARQLSRDGVAPQRILCSSALRALQTAQIVQLSLGLTDDVLQTEALLYQATPATLRHVAAQCDAGVDCLLVIGHNPGLSVWVSELSPPHARTALTTADFRVLPVAEWTDLER
jgi:phosphohistidine phosphatase